MGLVLSLSLAMPAQVAAYRTLADDEAIQVAASQPGGAVRWELSTANASDVDLVAFEAAARAGFATWSAVSCAALSIDFNGRTANPAIHGDGRSTIELVYEGWAARGFPSDRGATTDVQVLQLGPGAQISEADIYLNLEGTRFGDGADPTALDRQSILTHEIGHLLGLLHPCEIDAPPAPRCASSPAATSSVMYPTSSATPNRSLSGDDEAGICALYPRTGCALNCGLRATCVMDACEVCTNADCSPACPGPRCADRGCGSGQLCAEGICAVEGDQAGECVERGSEGSPCDAADACVSGLCLTRWGAGYCTRACEDDLDCPTGQRCAEEAHQLVCEPVPTPATCSARNGSRTNRLGAIAIAAIAIGIQRRKRRNAT